MRERLACGGRQASKQASKQETKDIGSDQRGNKELCKRHRTTKNIFDGFARVSRVERNLTMIPLEYKRQEYAVI